MSRIFAQSVTADLCGRLFNRLLFVLLLPMIMLLALLPQRERAKAKVVSATAPQGLARRLLRSQGDLKPGP